MRHWARVASVIEKRFPAKKSTLRILLSLPAAAGGHSSLLVNLSKYWSTVCGCSFISWADSMKMRMQLGANLPRCRSLGETSAASVIHVYRHPPPPLHCYIAPTISRLTVLGWSSQACQSPPSKLFSAGAGLCPLLPTTAFHAESHPQQQSAISIANFWKRSKEKPEEGGLGLQ